MSAREDSGRVPAGGASVERASAGRSTASISAAQTAPIRIHHLTETLCADDPALRRSLPEAAERALRLCGGRTADAAAIDAALSIDPVDGPIILQSIEADHAHVGAALCRAWGLPPAVAEAAEFHHDRRAGRRGRLPSQLAAATDVIALHVTGASGSATARQPIFSEVGLSPAHAAAVIAEVEATLALLAAVGTARA